MEQSGVWGLFCLKPQRPAWVRERQCVWVAPGAGKTCSRLQSISLCLCVPAPSARNPFHPFVTACICVCVWEGEGETPCRVNCGGEDEQCIVMLCFYRSWGENGITIPKACCRGCRGFNRDVFPCFYTHDVCVCVVLHTCSSLYESEAEYFAGLNPLMQL